MNPEKDYYLYTVSDRALRIGSNPIDQRKVLHTRMLKLPSYLSKSGYPEIGFALFDAGQFQKCIPPLKKAVIANPTNIRAQITLAKAFLNLQKEDQCFSSIKKAIVLSPGDSELHRFVINIFERRNRLQILSSFYKSIEEMLINSKSISALYFEIAETLVSCDKRFQALVFYKKAIKMSTTPSLNHYARYAMALYHEELFEEAVVQFENLKRLDPKGHLACNNLAYIHFLLGNTQKALKELEYIRENGLEGLETYLNYLLVLYYLDEDEKIIKQYKDILKPYIGDCDFVFSKVYEEALMKTKRVLEKDEIDDETKEFNFRKFHALIQVLSFLKCKRDSN